MAEIWNLSALCRCCHKDGQFTDLRTLLQDSDTRNYTTLLQETFNISMEVPLFDASYAICDTCIEELSRAHNFKVQVAGCERKFHEYCQNELATQCDLKQEVESLHEDDELATQCDMKVEIESLHENVSDDNDNCGFDDFETEGLTDDPIEIKLEDVKPELADDQKDEDENQMFIKTKKEIPKRPRGRPKKNEGGGNKIAPFIVSIQALHPEVQKYVKDEGDTRTCTLCNYTYAKHVFNTYGKHLQQEHSINIEYKCDECGKKFINNSFLAMHNFYEHPKNQKRKLNPDTQPKDQIRKLKPDEHPKHQEPKADPNKKNKVTQSPTSGGIVKKEDGIPDYRSDKSESEVSEDELPQKKRRTTHKEWVFWNTFSNMKDAEDCVNAENTWSRRCTRMTEDGQKRFYRCNKVKKKGPQCAAEVYLLLASDNDDVLLYRKVADHNHQDIGIRDDYGINERAKVEINKLYDLHLKPRAILAALQRMDGIAVPSKRQLNNYLSSIRRSRFGNCAIHLGELEKWLSERENVPDDENEPFALKYQITEGEQPTFRFALTTRKLLNIARSIEVLHADATNKLIWQGCPVLIVGATNKNRNFFPLCLGVSATDRQEDFEVICDGFKEKIKLLFDDDFQPKVLVCDAAETIKNAFLSVFGSNLAVRVCWAHARKNMQKKLEQTIEKSQAKGILEDIDALHEAPSAEVFNAACRAFIEKYATHHTFIEYFEQEWIVKHPNWFLGAAPLSPATNNALEAFSKSIKDKNTVRERYPLSSFLVVASEMVTQWSSQITEESFPETHTIELEEWTEGYRWAKRNLKVTGLSSDASSTTYIVPNENTDGTSPYDESWHTFDEYKEKLFAFRKTTLCKKEWRQSTCTCPHYFKKYICKHIIGLAVRLKLVTLPLEAKIIPIGQKKKPGKPSKCKPALIVP